MIDLEIAKNIPKDARELIMRLIRTTRPHVDIDRQEHVSFCISQLMQMMYLQGLMSGMRDGREIREAAFAEIMKSLEGRK